MVFFGSQEVLFLWDLWQFPTGRNQEKLFVLGLEHRIQGGLGCRSYDVSICINSKWVWVNTYRYIFSGLFTSINPSYFGVH